MHTSAIKHGHHNQATHGRKGRAGQAGASAYSAARASGASIAEARTAARTAVQETRAQEKADAQAARVKKLTDRAAHYRELATGNATDAQKRRYAERAAALEARARGEKVPGKEKTAPPILRHAIEDVGPPSKITYGRTKPDAQGRSETVIYNASPEERSLILKRGRGFARNVRVNGESVAAITTPLSQSEIHDLIEKRRPIKVDLTQEKSHRMLQDTLHSEFLRRIAPIHYSTQLTPDLIKIRDAFASGRYNRIDLNHLSLDFVRDGIFDSSYQSTGYTK